VTDDDKRPRTVPQHEIDAQILRDKTARLRELRLAREAASGPVVRKVAPAAKSRKAAGGGGGGGGSKGSTRSVSLADWLDTQDREGRRN
jgi:hypothetical protein